MSRLLKWFFALTAIFLLACLGFAWTIYRIHILPLYDQAQTYDLAELDKLETASIITDAQGQPISRIYVQNREPITIENVPAHFIQSVTAAEDSRYFEHRGVDYWGIARAVLANLKAGKAVQGASTITQQLARQTFGLKERSYRRKLLEAFVAVRIEKEYTKEQILELYLNRIYFGSGFYGIEAASKGYFGKPARELTLPESATLSGLIKSPNRLSPLNNPEQSILARNYVLERMQLEGMLTSREASELAAAPLTTTTTSALSRSNYAYELIRTKTIEQIGFENAASGGFRIETTIDPTLQRLAEEKLHEHLTRIEQREKYPHLRYAQFSSQNRDLDAGTPYLQGALLVLDNHSGAILAIVGGRDFNHSKFNRALQARRPTGSAFLPFVYASAYSQNISPLTTLEDVVMDNRQVMIGGFTGILGEWGTETPDNRFEGDITARRALVHSKNSATVRLGNRVGLESVKNLAAKSGISSPLRDYPSTYLGSSEATLEEMCLAYSVLPNLGHRPSQTHIIQRIRDAEGKIVYEIPPSEHIAALEPRVAFQVHDSLREVLTRGTAQSAYRDHQLEPEHLAGKTGTAYDFTDAWFIGYSSEITCGVWAGFDRPTTIYRGAFSKDLALPVWVAVLNAAQKNYPAQKIAPPAGLRTVEVCRHSGQRATDNCYEKTQRDGRTYLVRTTYREWVKAESELDLKPCPIHSQSLPESITLPLLVENDLFQQTRAAPIVILTPAVIGAHDPYGAQRPIVRASAPLPGTGENSTLPAVIRRAQPVLPLESTEEQPLLRLEPPPPLEFE